MHICEVFNIKLNLSMDSRIVLRRLRIHSNNIVSLLHGIALISCISSAEFKVYYHYVIKINSINALNTWHIPPFLSCSKKCHILDLKVSSLSVYRAAYSEYK